MPARTQYSRQSSSYSPAAQRHALPSGKGKKGEKMKQMSAKRLLGVKEMHLAR